MTTLPVSYGGSWLRPTGACALPIERPKHETHTSRLPQSAQVPR
jgi:hypothetical protein